MKRERPAGSRIPRSQIVGVEIARESGAITKVQVYVVPKNRVLDDAVPKEACLSPESFEELPEGFSEDAFWLVDAAVPRAVLGFGVFVFETFFKSVARYAVTGEDAVPSIVDQPAAGATIRIVGEDHAVPQR